jgi:orotidine-5'-phosphate decarboxylase
MLAEELGIPGKVEDSVLRLARLAYESGADGVVCSGWESSKVKRATAADFLVVTPGIRPAGADAGDQKRIVTPADAIKAGADYLVIGRPITRAIDPKAVYAMIVEEMKQGLQ